MHIDKKLLVELNNNPSLTNCSSHFMKEAGMVETPQLQGGELWQVSGKETLRWHNRLFLALSAWN